MQPRSTPPNPPADSAVVAGGNAQQGLAKPTPGRILGGRYSLVEPLASGGMAQVWRGQDRTLNRPVAIKVLHAHLGTDEAFLTRFRREAVASARLAHPSIVAVYDTVSEDGIEAIVMELIEGQTLRALLNDVKVLPPETIVDFGAKIASALDEAHRAGVVHRDIKPANIMVGEGNRVLVADFGIAKANKDADLTNTGTLLGTAKYLAPEQVAGEPVDPRADLYSLGVVLFEAATGEPPFKSETDAATALARLQGDVPRCRERKADVPVELDAVIAKTMARQPADRYDRAVSLRRALLEADLSIIELDLSDSSHRRQDRSLPNTGVNDTVLPDHLNVDPGAVTHRAVPPPGQTPLNQAPQNQAQWNQPLEPGPPATPPPGFRRDGTAIMPAGDLAINNQGTSGSTRSRDRKPPSNQARRKSKPNQAVQSPRRWPVLAAVSMLVIGGLVIGSLLLWSAFTADTGPGDAFDTDDFSPGDVKIVESVPLDPFDRGRSHKERHDLAPFAIDGDTSKAWTTETYSRERMGGLKPGVGLIITLNQETSLNSVDLVTESEGFAVEFYIGSNIGPNDPTFQLDELGDPIGSIEGSGNVTVTLSADADQVGDQLLIWITETGTHEDSSVGSVHRFVLNEVAVS